MFNALKYIRALEGVGFPREQAEAQVQLVIDSFQENVATKGDMAELKNELKSEMTELKTELKSEMAELKTELRSEMAELMAELKSDIAGIKAQMAELKTDLVFRLGGLIVVCTGILGVLIKS